MTVSLSLGLLDEEDVAAATPVDEAPAEDESLAGEEDLRAYGLAVTPLSSDELADLDLPGYEAGVVVTELSEDSPFVDQGLTVGDVILEIDNIDVGTSSDVARSIRSADEDGAGIMAAVIVRAEQRIWLILRTR